MAAIAAVGAEVYAQLLPYDAARAEQVQTMACWLGSLLARACADDRPTRRAVLGRLTDALIADTAPLLLQGGEGAP